ASIVMGTVPPFQDANKQNTSPIKIMALQRAADKVGPAPPNVSAFSRPSCAAGERRSLTLRIRVIRSPLPILWAPGVPASPECRKENRDAEVRDRARDSGGRVFLPAAVEGNFPDVVWGAPEHGPADPVGPELRHRRHDLLRLHRAQRG